MSKVAWFGNWHLPPRRVVLWHAVSAVPLALVVALGAYLSYHYHALSVESRDRADLAYEAVDQIEAIVVAVEQAEVAERDFIIAGSDQSLSGFQSGLRTAEAGQRALLQMLRGGPIQLQRFARLQQAVAVKTSELAETVSLRQRAGFEGARSVIARGDDQKLMEGVRAAAQSLIAEERQILTRRQQAAREHERHILLAGIVIATLSVSIRLGTAWVVNSLRKRRRAEL